MAVSSASRTGGRYWLTLALVGVVGGVLSGLFAIGGGILMVPLLVWRTHLDQRRASATSLAAIVPAAIVGSATYLVNGEVDVAAAVFIAIGAAGGAVMGSAWLRRIPLAALRWMFIFFILAVAGRLLFVVPQRGDDLALSPTVALGYVALGLVMGVASGLFGIGGGIIAVPLLVSFFAVSDLVAKGTALLVTIPTSLVGTVANRRAGLVDIRVALVVGLAAAVAAVPAAGAALAMPARLSAVLFSGLLIAVATQLVVKSVRTARRNKPLPDRSGSAHPSTSSSPDPEG